MKKKIQVRILIFSVFVFFLGNLFNVGLSIPTFRELSVANSLSGYHAVSTELRDSIEGPGGFDRGFDDPVGLEGMFNELAQRHPEVDNIAAFRPDGALFFSLNSIGVHPDAPPPRNADGSETGKRGRRGDAAMRHEPVGGYFHLVSPMEGSGAGTLGAVDVIVSEKTVLRESKKRIERSLKLMGALSLVASLFLMGGLLAWVDYNAIRIPKKRICLLLYIFLTCTQLFYSCHMVADIESERISSLVRERVESSTAPSPGARPPGWEYRYARAASSVIWEELSGIISDALTILVITFIFTTELIIFLFILVDKFQAENMEEIVVSETDRRQPITSYSLIRPDAFIFCFALDLPVSFLPLYAEELFTPIWGLSRDVIIGLPISATMICACVAFIVAGAWIDRHGWRICHFRGVFLVIVGMALSGVATSSLDFILYQGVIGFGYGLTFISYMAYVYENTNKHQRTIGFSVMSAGMFSGTICGGAVGGMLAERIAYSSVFLASTALLGLALVFPYLFMRRDAPKKVRTPVETAPRINAALLLRFCLNRNILSLLLLLSIPSAIVFVGFLFYFSPVYLDRLGVSEADIARILMINGIGLIYLSPLISPIIDRSSSKKKFIVISGVLTALAMMTFSLIDGVPAVIISIALISVAGAFGNSPRTVYALQQKAALELGSGLSMSLYRAVDRIGWVLGPMVVGLILALGNIRTGLTIMGVACLGFTLLFFIFSKEETGGRASASRR